MQDIIKKLYKNLKLESRNLNLNLFYMHDLITMPPSIIQKINSTHQKIKLKIYLILIYKNDN